MFLVSFADIFESLGNVILATDEEQIATTSSDADTNAAAPSTTTTASPEEPQQPIESQEPKEEDIQEQRQQVICFHEDDKYIDLAVVVLNIALGIGYLFNSQTKLRGVNVFTGACLFIAGLPCLRWGRHPPPGQLNPPAKWWTSLEAQKTNGQQIGGTVLLEYILVKNRLSMTGE